MSRPRWKRFLRLPREDSPAGLAFGWLIAAVIVLALPVSIVVFSILNLYEHFFPTYTSPSEAAAILERILLNTEGPWELDDAQVVRIADSELERIWTECLGLLERPTEPTSEERAKIVEGIARLRGAQTGA